MKNDFKGLRVVAKEPKMAAAKMIKMLYRSGEFEFSLTQRRCFASLFMIKYASAIRTKKSC
ncbi:hypothetical protein VB002_05920 [Campylobacter concisus]